MNLKRIMYSMVGNNFKKIKFFIEVFCLVLACLSGIYVSVTKSELKFSIENNSGNITWYSGGIKAKTNIRWQPKGYYLSLEPSDKDDFGYPLRRKSPMITLYINSQTVKESTDGEKNGVYNILNVLDGHYLKNTIINNKKFYKELVNKYKKGDKTLYIDTFFETYQVILDAGIKKKVIAAYRKKKKADFLKPDGKYIYIDGSKYEYNANDKMVKKIRKNDLTDIDKIRKAEPWSAEAKKQWLNKTYYNHEIKYEIYSNVIIKYVDLKGNLIGDKRLDVKINKTKAKELEINGKNLSNPHYAFKKDNLPKNLIETNTDKYFGDEVTIKLPKEINVTRNGKIIKYKLVSSEYREQETPNIAQKMKSGEEADKQKIVLGNENSVVVGVYEGPPPLISWDNEGMSNELESPEPLGIIGSGTLEDSPFDIEEGIPGNEYYYKNVITDSYLLKYRFKKKNGKKEYQIKSYINWHITKKKGKKKSKIIRVDYTTAIKRKFSYWYIDNLEVYTLDGAFLYNDAIPDSGSKILTSLNLAPKVEALSGFSEDWHLKPPLEIMKIINLGEREADGETIPGYNPDYEVECKVGELMVRNDRLSIDDKLIMDDSFIEKSAPTPIKPASKGEKISNRVLYEYGNMIAPQTQNGNYESYGKVSYTLTTGINAEGESSKEFEIEYVNPVNVHTPVVCDYNITDAKKWCQLIEPDKSMYQLVLEKDFSLDILTTGNHLDIKGYGDRDYSKYTLKKEVIFPFDVEKDRVIYPANQGIKISDNTTFHLPMTVDEGKYEIVIRTYAVNCLDDLGIEDYANLSIENYIAENRVGVEVSGRLIDFTLLDIKNTLMWEKSDGGFIFNDGVRLNKLPLIYGDSPKYQNEGEFKKGYAVSFAVTSIGNYYYEPYGIRMDFDFYIIDKGSGIRKAVDLYYEEVSPEKKKFLGLIKVGSKRDDENLHFIKVSGKNIGLYRYNLALLPRVFLDNGSNQYIQRWRGEYSLPEKLYVCDKGFDMDSYMKHHSFIDFEEDYWIKSGNLVVSAEISSLKDKRKVLSYINSLNEGDGYFNNWKYEVAGRVKTDADGRKINFKDGDLFVYDLSKMIWKERRSEVKKVY